MLREHEIPQTDVIAGMGPDSLVAETSRESVFSPTSAASSSDEVESRKPAIDTGEERSQDGDIIGDVERDLGTKRAEGRGRKRIVGTLILFAIGLCVLLSFWFMSGSGAAKKARVPVNSKSGGGSDSEETMTRDALKLVNGEGPGVTFGDGSVVRPEPSPGSSPDQSVRIEQPGSVTDLPQSPSSLSTTVQPERSASNNALNDSSNQSTIAKVLSLGKNNERSVRIGEESLAGVAPPARRDGPGREENRSSAGVALPSFGSMLPVKSLGVIYTLRSGGLVRFELTRDVKGKGWSLPHGTVLVGALRGAEYDRAFISLVGFIDSESGKLVKVAGDVLGPDGGSGVRGRKRSMSSGWSKALRKLGEAGLNIAGAAAGSIGRRPVIITDAYSQSRVGNEFDGMLSNKNSDSFVEVAAGTSCYVMITDLPERIQGVDALSKLSRAELEEKSDADQRRDATGISERELADLIQSGDVARIRGALSRMTPEMRRVAEAVIADGGDR